VAALYGLSIVIIFITLGIVGVVLVGGVVVLALDIQSQIGDYKLGCDGASMRHAHNFKLEWWCE